tara:strand:+ start:178 stop:1266 length:1089 start_codon:yes stop_codon:yes gene_type:complete
LKNIILQNFNQDEIDSLVLEIVDCQADILQINQFLPLYFNDDSSILKERYRTAIKEMLKNVETKNGFQLFAQLFDIKAFNKETLEQVSPSCLDVIDNIQINSGLRLPWELSSRFLYTDEIEDNFLEDPLRYTDLFIDNAKDFKYLYANDPMHQAVINIMASPTGNLRTNEIFNMYFQLLLAKEMKSDFKSYSINGVMGTADLDKTGAYEKEIKTLFKRYYEKIKSTMDPKEFVNPKTDVGKLINELHNLKNKIVDLKNINIQALIKFNAAEINELVLEIRNFLKANKLNELIWPKVKEINVLDGGPGLLKKIYAKGKMKDVGEMYIQAIRPIIEAENIIQAPIRNESQNGTTDREKYDFDTQ